MDKPQKKPIRQNDDDFDNGYDTGYNVAHTEWEKYHHMVLHESNCEWYNKGLEAQKNINKRNELTEDELLFIITPKGLPPLPKHIRLAKKIIEARKGVIWTQR